MTDKIKSNYPRIGGNDICDLHAVRKPRFVDGPPVTVMSHSKIAHDHRAAMAVSFVEKWAMVAGEPDGEDGAGRQKLRRMTPAELADHACAAVEALEAAFAARG